MLLGYGWPGNVRELANVLSASTERAKARALPHSAATPSAIDSSDIDLSYAKVWPTVSRDDFFYYYDAEIKLLGEQIRQEETLPPAGEGEKRHERRAMQRAALLYLDAECPRAEWPRALQSCWNRLFGPKWATAEKRRGLRLLLLALSVNIENEIATKKARDWLLARVGTGDGGFDPKRTVR